MNAVCSSDYLNKFGPEFQVKWWCRIIAFITNNNYTVCVLLRKKNVNHEILKVDILFAYFLVLPIAKKFPSQIRTFFFNFENLLFFIIDYEIVR